MTTTLSAADARLLTLLASGLTDKAIAREMNLSPFTVGDHVKRIRAALGARNRTAAAAAAARAEAQAKVAEACAALCEAEAEHLAAATAPDADGIKRNAVRSLVARGLGAAIRDQFNLPRR